ADEKKDGEDADQKGDKKEGADKKAPAPVRIDFDGLADRVVALPIEADNIGSLGAAGKYLIYTVSPAAYYGRPAGAKTQLKLFDFEKRESSDLADDVANWAVSHDGSTVLVRSGSSYTR